MIDGVSTATGGVSLAAQGDGLKKVAKQFEAVFMRQMIGSMRSASLGDDVFGSSAGEQFRDMQDSRLADGMAEKGGFGLAELLVKQFAARAGTAAPDTAALSKATAADAAAGAASAATLQR